MEMLAGWRAVSLAGNDKGRVYVIKEDCGEYVFLSDENGKNINSVDDIDKGERINLAFKDGYAKAVISSKEKA